ncbi:hypothetical protein PPERSA_04363 [Pseudocohnilembus persalinus]|uniref:FAD-binding domain-containing protein n=1 Tax=Pseudocohnilembus persalinus TaxID=266149 RepID=A0A0V0QQM0_PSEPJ|nr:hypothetical protein PPERSA_04363 [Pseudocohnilembus persalinus]|eukprot:KRX04548.1 hypothetical protein PPERSA_04363 [Pseudocohnilembus persalinus]
MRQQVRKILLGLKNILWGYQVNEIKQLENFKIQVNFKNKDKIIEQSQVFDIVFSCEGVFSKLRNQFIKDNPIYLGLNMINGIIDVSKQSIKNNNSYSIVDQTSHRLFFKPFQKGQMMWQLTSVMGLVESKQLASGNQEKWIQYVRENLKDWKHPILECIFNTDKNQMRCGPLFYRNSIQQKLNLNNILFLGDAIHPMPPFKGQGANQAFV